MRSFSDLPSGYGDKDVIHAAVDKLKSGDVGSEAVRDRGCLKSIFHGYHKGISDRLSGDALFFQHGLQELKIRRIEFEHHGRVAGFKLHWAAAGNNLPAVDDHDRVGVFCFFHVMGCQKDGHAQVLSDLIDDLPDHPAGLRVKPGGWFVQKKNFGLVHQGAGNIRPTALAT